MNKRAIEEMEDTRTKKNSKRSFSGNYEKIVYKFAKSNRNYDLFCNIKFGIC